MEFVLKTETERRLYVDALLHCIDHGTLTEKAVLRDLDVLMMQSAEAAEETLSRGRIISRLEDILMSYRYGDHDRESASNLLLAEINEFAKISDPI